MRTKTYRNARVGRKFTTAHRALVEKLLGRELPEEAEIHHVDGDGENNEHSNLVVCPNHAYHALLHKRTQALEAVGDPTAERCRHCKKYDLLGNLLKQSNGVFSSPKFAHRACNRAYNRRIYVS